ncbi:hypothetical protein ID852_20140 [Xenorhabdus sp. 42]|uniref:hypothetical protein n=1 Tax=Xenorhabdus szentirmaii TaxID=290112 RepID=UPI0019BD3954|nr:hypothetical protein [Xenorhabdus sp. 42]MBD2822925.1 hypothetical protein [Xenorhabdus sp. 42]
MSDSNESKDFKPYVDRDNLISMKDFFDYLEDMGVSSICPACGKPKMSGILSVEKGQSLALNVISKDTSDILAHECVGRICVSCGNIQLFWTNFIKTWMKKKNHND